MIFSDIRVEIPTEGVWRWYRSETTTYLCMDPAKAPNCPAKYKGKKGVMVGRVKQEDGREFLIPNEAYYELMGLEPPRSAKKEGAGRKPDHDQEKADARKKGAIKSAAYGVLGSLLLKELGVTACLEEAFAPESVPLIEAFALYLAERRNSSFDGLKRFTEKNLPWSAARGFDRGGVRELFDSISPGRRRNFYEAWNARQPKGPVALYDVDSFSFYPTFLSGCDTARMPRFNLSLFCARGTNRPLFMCDGSGSLGQSWNFNVALEQAKANGAENSPAVVVPDSLSDWQTFTLMHFTNCRVITKIHYRHYSEEIIRMYCDWARELSDTVSAAKGFAMPQVDFVADSLPFAFGGIQGRLVFYRDLNLYSLKLQELMDIRKNKYDELNGLARIPDWATNFEAWAQCYRPFFKLEKAAGPTGFKFEEDKEGFARQQLLAGSSILFTNDEQSTPEELLRTYACKTVAEYNFDIMKYCIWDGWSNQAEDDSKDARLFIMFVAHILWREMYYRMRVRPKQYELSVEEMIEILEEVELTKTADGKWKLPHGLTAEQRDVISALQVSG